MVLLATNTSSLDILGFKKIPYDTCLSFALGKKKQLKMENRTPDTV